MLVAVALVIVVIAAGLASALLFSSVSPRDSPVSEDRTARVWVDLSSVSSGPITAEDRWGTVETFSNAKVGTTNYYRNVSLTQSPRVDSVVLDGYVWSMITADAQDQAFLRYTPEFKGPSWNVSFEVYAPQGGNFFDPAWGLQQIGLTATLVNWNGTRLASADLSYGSPNGSWVRITDIAGGSLYNLSDRILPPNIYKSNVEGTPPQRYIVSFQHSGGDVCTVTIYHTSGIVIGQAQIVIPPSWGNPAQLVLSTTSHVLNRQGMDAPLNCGAWVLDNFACRGATTRYPVAGPVYEYAGSGSTVPMRNATFGSEQVGASIIIGGVEARYNATTGRYEADLPLDVQWNKRIDYSVDLDGVRVNDIMSVTMFSSTAHASVANWWNGWDWVSVFGEDDCDGPATALTTYAGYDHPLTAYVMDAAGSSSDILATQSEIALHNPHDWQTTGQKTWPEAVSMATRGMAFLEANYQYASRWDAPVNGGSGDTYISMANPGNRATYQLMYALFDAGIRVDGRSTDGSGAPGNHSQIGSWYSPNGADNNGGWYPYAPIDLMDANRGLSWDNVRSWSSLIGQVDSVAQNHGVLRVYGHPLGVDPIKIPEFLHWIDDPKTNYSLENWKATDGEVASYIYGRWSTNVNFNEGSSTGDAWSFNITRKDPKAEGYWNVPVTVAIDLNGRTVKDVVVQDAGKSYRMSDGTLRDLNGARIMDPGYDIRNGTLYVSQCWGPSAKLTVTFEDRASDSTPMIDMSSLEMVMKDP
jgi:hypothetical protein